jgi:hypothetical protein
LKLWKKYSGLETGSCLADIHEHPVAIDWASDERENSVVVVAMIGEGGGRHGSWRSRWSSSESRIK